MRVLKPGAQIASFFDGWSQTLYELYSAYETRQAELQARLPPVVQSPLRPRLRAQTYNSKTSIWEPHDELSHSQDDLRRGDLLKLVSWNVHWRMLSPERWMTAALDHLQERFGADPESLIIMLHEVRKESLEAILKNPWVQQNFALTNTAPPSSIPDDIDGEGFIMKQLYWRATPYFTLMMVPRSLRTTSCFRVPFGSCMGRDALFVDLPIVSKRSQSATTSIRLCNAHLESWGATRTQADQLATISNVLKGGESQNSEISIGLFGGDTNSSSSCDRDLYRPPEVGLTDV